MDRALEKRRQGREAIEGLAAFVLANLPQLSSWTLNALSITGVLTSVTVTTTAGENGPC
jgi:hypothetical protein